MTSPQVDNTSNEGYERGLGSRQVQMIAIGGAIGVGLFMGAEREHRQGRAEHHPDVRPHAAW